MVPVYERKTDRGNVSRERLLQAASAVSNGSGFMTAAKCYGIDRMTLKRFIKRQKETPAGQDVLTGFSHLAETKQVLNTTHERELATYVTKLSDMYFGISAKNVEYLPMSSQKQMAKQFPHRGKKTGKQDWIGLNLFEKYTSSLLQL